MITALVAGLLAGYGIAIPVGAVGTYLVALTARTSLRVGSAAALGIATADGLYALAAVLGGSALAGLIAPVARPLGVLSALVLLTVAVLGARRALRESAGGPVKTAVPMAAPRAYSTLLGITLLNPVTIVYFAALVVGNKSAAAFDAVPQASVFVLAAFCASASWQLFLAFGGALLGRLVTGARGRLVTGLVSSAIVGGLAVKLLLSLL